MRGRKPKDLALKILQGNPSKRPLSWPAAPFTAGEPEKPKDLDADASAEWDRLVTNLQGIISPSDHGMILVAADAYSQLVAATRVIRKKGATYETRGEAGVMIRTRPECRLRDAARTSYHRALSELGASPVGHTRVRHLQKPNSKQSRVKDFLG